MTKDHTTILPYYKVQDKGAEMTTMFDNIAHRYDFLNHLLSLGIDKYWRHLAINSLKKYAPQYILDIATGTGDLALAAMRLSPQSIIGIDISEGMIKEGRKKIANKNLGHIITLAQGNAESLEYPDNSFDAITVAFGVRNFAHLDLGLREMIRVLRPNKQIAILEFSKPTIFPIKQLFSFYFRYILPTIGKFFSKDHRAYTYLPESVAVFPDGENFCEYLRVAGFKEITYRTLSFGICTLYNATK